MTKVEIVSRTQGVGIYQNLNAGEIVEAVARHGKIKDYGKLIRFLIAHRHWSPLEHVHFTFRIETSRDISAQMIRHRSFHWQELSQRYDEIHEIIPIDFRLQAEKNRQSSTTRLGTYWDDGLVTFDVKAVGNSGLKRIATQKQFDAMTRMADALNEVRAAYSDCIKAGIAKECARRGLPMASKTIVHMTGNLRDFLGYLNVRCEEDTQEEHREVAMGIGFCLETEFPELASLNWKEGGFM